MGRDAIQKSYPTYSQIKINTPLSIKALRTGLGEDRPGEESEL